jgi:DNA end-binding protein Ku
MNKVGIARVVIRAREHLAAVKPNGDALVLELMHFADEMVDQSSLDFPESETPPPNEMKVAKLLIDTMTAKFDPEQFEDKYREELLAMIEARAAGKSLPSAKPKVARSDKVVNLMDVLQQSLEQSRKRDTTDKRGGEEEEKPKRTTRRKKSAA